MGVAGLVALAVVVVLVVLLVGGGAVRLGLALALVVLLAVTGAVLLLGVQLRSALAELRGAETALVDRVGAVEQLQADLVSGLADLPGRVPRVDVAPDLERLAERLQLTGTLYALAPPTADVDPLPLEEVELAVVAVGELLERRPTLVVTTGAAEVALFLALAVRRHGLLGTRVVALDDDAQRVSDLAARAARHGVADVLEARHAPLARTGIEGHRTAWYAASGWSDLHGIGLAVVAGPPDSLGPRARLPFVPLLHDRLAPAVTVLVPDGGEVLEPWAGAMPTARATSFAPSVVGLRRT